MAMERLHSLFRMTLVHIHSSYMRSRIAKATPALCAVSTKRSSGPNPFAAVVAGVISAAFILSGCRSAISLFWNQPERTAALYGTYVADNKFARETLTLNPDGTYMQQVTLKSSSRVTVARGRWHYDSATAYATFDHHMMLVTNGFQHFNPGYATPRKEGLVSLPVDRLLGQIRIGAADDAAPYQKQ
jgi:hypothetical protein